MKQSRYSEEQIVGIVKEAEAGISVAELELELGTHPIYWASFRGLPLWHCNSFLSSFFSISTTDSALPKGLPVLNA